MTSTRRARLYAYTDESGNTGFDLFADDQPYFWTGTLLSPVDLDSIPTPVIGKTLAIAGVTELHGSVLRMHGVERIATRLMYLIRKYHLRVLFTRLEKRHVVVTKFTDTVMDAGLNKAVGTLQYNVKLFRLYFANIFAGLMDDADQRDFWGCYRTGNGRGLVPLYTRLRDRLRDMDFDPRSTELVTDALNWGMEHPEALLAMKIQEGDSPNLIALTCIISMLQTVHRDDGHHIAEFVHDEQNQFGTAMHGLYQLMTPLLIESSMFAPLPTITDTKAFQCAFGVRSSQDSFGLQLVDVFLWLVKRGIDHKTPLQGQCAALNDLLLRRGRMTSLTHHDMTESLIAGFRALQHSPLTPERIERGYQLAAELEARRRQRMQEPPE